MEYAGRDSGEVERLASSGSGNVVVEPDPVLSPGIVVVDEIFIFVLTYGIVSAAVVSVIVVVVFFKIYLNPNISLL